MEKAWNGDGEEAFARAPRQHTAKTEMSSRLEDPAEKVSAVDRTHDELRKEQNLLFPGSHETSAIEPAQRSVKPVKSWLQRLLFPDPPESRKAPREALPGPAAYFFTGGVPVAHDVREISRTGMYVVTTERWYPGTVVTMTLTDRRQPTVERSIILNATVVHWGNDGVGLAFLVRDDKDRRPRPASGMAESVDRMEVDRFVQQLRTAGG